MKFSLSVFTILVASSLLASAFSNESTYRSINCVQKRSIEPSRVRYEHISRRAPVPVQTAEQIKKQIDDAAAAAQQKRKDNKAKEAAKKMEADVKKADEHQGRGLQPPPKHHQQGGKSP